MSDRPRRGTRRAARPPHVADEPRRGRQRREVVYARQGVREGDTVVRMRRTTGRFRGARGIVRESVPDPKRQVPVYRVDFYAPWGGTRYLTREQFTIDRKATAALRERRAAACATS
jgi:hypothetical protein